MEPSESINAPNPNIGDSELGFLPPKPPGSDGDLAPSDDSYHTKEYHTVALQDKLRDLDLKESKPVSKEEVEKDGNWDVKEVEQEQWIGQETEDSNWPVETGAESGWDRWNVDENDNVNNAIEKVVMVVGEESDATNGNDDTNAQRLQHQYQYPVRPEAEDCSFYLKTGTCKFGSNCKFNHPVRRKTQAVKEKVKEKEDTSERLGQTECKYYLRSGGCKYGKACRYNHTRCKTSGTTLELNFLGLPIRQGEKECPYYMRNGSCKYGANCKFNHPDPTSDAPSGYGNGGSVSLGASPSPIASWSQHRTSHETAPFVPLVLPPPPVAPPQSPEWNGYQVPVYPQERSLHPPATYVMNPTATEANVFTHHQQVQVDEYPERPGQPECSYFLKTGDCKFKSNCKYHHPKDWAAKSPPCALSDKGLPLRPDQSVCTHYSRYGICKYGPACKFNHPTIPASPSMTGLDQHPPLGNSATTDNAGICGTASGSDATLQQSL